MFGSWSKAFTAARTACSRAGESYLDSQVKKLILLGLPIVRTDDSLSSLARASEGNAGIAFSPDGKRLGTQNENITTWIYVLDIDELIAIAKSRLTHW